MLPNPVNYTWRRNSSGAHAAGWGDGSGDFDAGLRLWTGRDVPWRGQGEPDIAFAGENAAARRRRLISVRGFRLPPPGPGRERRGGDPTLRWHLVCPDLQRRRRALAFRVEPAAIMRTNGSGAGGSVPAQMASIWARRNRSALIWWRKNGATFSSVTSK